MERRLDDDGLVRAHVPTIRAQAAIVRTLIDAFDRVLPPGTDLALEKQIVDELARLGCRALEAAAAFANARRSDDGTDEDIHMIVFVGS